MTLVCNPDASAAVGPGFRHLVQVRPAGNGPKGSVAYLIPAGFAGWRLRSRERSAAAVFLNKWIYRSLTTIQSYNRILTII